MDKLIKEELMSSPV